MKFQTGIVGVIKRKIIAISVALILPSMLSLASDPAYAGSVDEIKEKAIATCGQAKDMANDLFSLWEAVEMGRAQRSLYDQEYAKFRRQKQSCQYDQEQLKKAVMSANLPSASDIAKFAAGRLAGAAFRTIHPSYLGAFGLGQMLDQEGANMRIHWRSIRVAIANTDNLTEDEGPQNKGPFSFLHKYEMQDTENDIKNIEYLADLTQKSLSEGEQRDAASKIEELQKRINIRFISHGKDPLFLIGWVGRWSVHGNILSKKKLEPVKGILVVTDGPAGAFMEWSSKGKSVFQIPINIEGDQIRVRVSDLPKPKPSNNNSSGMDFGLSKIDKMLQEILMTLRITRQGNVCTIVVSQKKQISKTKLNCDRM